MDMFFFYFYTIYRYLSYEMASDITNIISDVTNIILDITNSYIGPHGKVSYLSAWLM